MTNRTTLRPSTPQDRELLYRIYASTRAGEMAVVPWSEQQKEDFLRFQFDAQDRYYREHFPRAAYDLVMLDGEPIGRLYVDRRADEIRLIDIALLPEHRGAAAGKPVRIHVEHDNPAMRLYRRLGFSKIEEQGVYHLMEWRPPDNEGA